MPKNIYRHEAFSDSWLLVFRFSLFFVHFPSFSKDFRGSAKIDERQITHLICTLLKYDLYDFFRGVLGLLPVFFLYKRPQDTP